MVAVLTVLGRFDQSVSGTRGAAAFLGKIPAEAEVWVVDRQLLTIVPDPVNSSGPAERVRAACQQTDNANVCRRSENFLSLLSQEHQLCIAILKCLI